MTTIFNDIRKKNLPILKKNSHKWNIILAFHKHQLSYWLEPTLTQGIYWKKDTLLIVFFFWGGIPKPYYVLLTRKRQLMRLIPIVWSVLLDCWVQLFFLVANFHHFEWNIYLKWQKEKRFNGFSSWKNFDILKINKSPHSILSSTR